MMIGLSTFVSEKWSKVMFLTMPLPTLGPAQALILAPFSAFVIVMLLAERIFNFQKH